MPPTPAQRAHTPRIRAYVDQLLERVAANELARRIKLVDLAENLENNNRCPDAPGIAERIVEYESALVRLNPPAEGVAVP